MSTRGGSPKNLTGFSHRPKQGEDSGAACTRNHRIRLRRIDRCTGSPRNPSSGRVSVQILGVPVDFLQNRAQVNGNRAHSKLMELGKGRNWTGT